MTQKGWISIEELSENINTTIKRLKTLEELVENSPGSSELSSYLRIAIASLRTAINRV